MPLNTKGKKILKAMKEQYGSDAKKVFYASKNKGVIKNVEKKMSGGLSGGKRSGPPPLRGPNPQGLKIKKMLFGGKSSATAEPQGGGGNFSQMSNRNQLNTMLNSISSSGLGKMFQNQSKYYNFPDQDEEELQITKAYLGKEIKQPTETKKEFGTRHEVHTKLKESEIFRKGSKVSDASPMLKEGGMSCPYRRGGKTGIQGVSKIQVKGQKFTGVK